MFKLEMEITNPAFRAANGEVTHAACMAEIARILQRRPRFWQLFRRERQASWTLGLFQIMNHPRKRKDGMKWKTRKAITCSL